WERHRSPGGTPSVAAEFPGAARPVSQPTPDPCRLRSALGVRALRVGLGVLARALGQALPEFPRRLTQRFGQLGQLRTAEEEHDDEEDDDELRSPESSHGSVLSVKRCGHTRTWMPPDAVRPGYRPPATALRRPPVTPTSLGR